jgi:Dolichyl-phosphate-mannose-protein mannosyltransferase
MSVIAQPIPATSAPVAGRWVRKEIVFLLAITAIGCFFRFLYLDRPALWNDEGLAFGRTCGTYEQMLRVLRSDGFGPLHYEVLWVLAQRFHMTPFMMRVWPAVTGTLMVPAIYLLAFELLGRRVARAATVYAACSAFLLAYSRDGKMYMPLWFFMTLNVGCLLWWMRTGKWTAWLVCVAAGCAATGLHVTGLATLGLDLLIGMTGASLTWKKSMLLVLALVLIAAGPIGYFGMFNEMSENIDREGWGATGIDWVDGRTGGHDGANLTADSAGGILFTFMWIDESKVRVMVPPRIMESAAALLGLMSAAAVCGLVGWRMHSRPPTLQHWRAALWLAIWILVPVYAFYRVTVPEAAKWRDWWESAREVFVYRYLYLWMLGGLLAAGLLHRYRWTRLTPAIIAAVLISWSVGFVVAQAVLMDSYSTAEAPKWLGVYPGVEIAAFIAAAAIGWTAMRRMGPRLVATLGVGLLVGIVLGLFWVVDKAIDGREIHPVWILRYLGFISPAVIIAMSALLLRLPLAWLRWSVFGLLLAVNLVQGAAHLWVSSEPRIDLAAADVIAAMNSDGKTLAFTANASPSLGPNTAGSIEDFVGSYYLFMLANKPTTPQDIRGYHNADNFFPIRLETDPGSIQAAVSGEPKTRRIIVWDGLDVGQRDRPEDLLQVLGKQWRRESQEVYPVRNFWDWGELYAYRRRVYVR